MVFVKHFKNNTHFFIDYPPPPKVAGFQLALQRLFGCINKRNENKALISFPFDLQRLKPTTPPRVALCPRRSRTPLTSRAMRRWERPSATAARLGEEEGCLGGGCWWLKCVWAGVAKNPELMRNVEMEEVRRWRRVKERGGFITGEVRRASDDEG